MIPLHNQIRSSPHPQKEGTLASDAGTAVTSTASLFERGDEQAKEKSVGMVTRITDPWKVNEGLFPESGSPEDQLKFLLNYAVLAPSSHNSQPWRFRVKGPEVALYADRTRALPVVDPDDREMIISCGAALFNLRTALHGFGYTAKVRSFPILQEPDLLAVVQMRDRSEASDDWTRLFHAIKRRRTNRNPFEQKLLPQRVLRLLREAASSEGGCIDVFSEPEDRAHLASLIATADRTQSSDKGFRREVASWLHPGRTTSLDGIPGYSYGINDWLTNAGPNVVRTFEWGNGKAAHDQQLAEGSPALLVLSTDADTVADWFTAGQALERVLLTATDLGLMASFLNQPVEVGDLRPKVAKLLHEKAVPQIILRVGYGNPVRPTPRRPVREVMKRY